MSTDAATHATTRTVTHNAPRTVTRRASQTAEMKRFNDDLIAEFRAGGGRLGGAFEGRQILLLTTVGRHSGRPRTVPLAYSGDRGGYVVTASNRGAETLPQWYRNLRADPAARVEVGGRTLRVRASEVTDAAERARRYAAHVALLPTFGDCAAVPQRTIPVIVLTPSEPVEDPAR